MTVARGFTIVVSSGLGFGLGGAGFGFLLARLFPSYYRGVFPAGEAPWFDPLQVGIGLGASQGLSAGLAISSVVVLAAALTERRGPDKHRLDHPV